MAQDPDEADGTEENPAGETAGSAVTEETTGAVTADQGRIDLSYGDYQELMTLARERDEFLKRLQRAVADYQNLQKRVERFREAARLETVRSLAEAILPVADSLSLAVEAAQQTEGADGIVEGLEIVTREFSGALQSLDIRPIEAVGEPFDPHYHEAVLQEPAGSSPPNTVVRELKKGFMLGDTVIRPAQVVVAGPGPGGES
jgi:molecular chaperone GrpE